MTKLEELQKFLKELRKKYKKKKIYLHELTVEEIEKFTTLKHECQREQIAKVVNDSKVFEGMEIKTFEVTFANNLKKDYRAPDKKALKKHFENSNIKIKRIKLIKEVE